MTDTASISTLLSASAVVGALTTGQVFTWYVESAQLLHDVTTRSPAQKDDDELSRGLSDRATQLAAKQKALLWVASIQWVVVVTLLAVGLCLANPWRGHGFHGELIPFALASCALILALALVPGIIAGTAVHHVRKASSKIS